ncbi:MAG: type IV pilus assembly protein PilM [Candidatus Doudnabacteria bacterium]|nr:type IV pilus assembly protein PilM [Candidatus Doudnabacteria bacterium]
MNVPEFFSLDIGNHSIKVAQVKREKNDTAKLLHVGAVNADLGMLEAPGDDALAKIAEQLKQAKDAAGIRTNNCVAAVPETPIFSRLLSIPKVDNTEVEEAVHWELKPLIPVPLEDVDVAFMEIGEAKKGEQTFVDMYVVAAPKVLTTRYKRLAQLAGLNLLALETESLANTRAVTFNHPTEKDILIFDFGAFSTDLIIARDGVPVFAQSISTGSDALTKAVAADYGLGMQEAEKYKRAYGIDFKLGDGKVAKSIEPIMQIIINEMSRTFTYFKERVGETGANKIYLCGEAAKLPGLSDYFTQKFGLTSILVDPVARITMDDTTRKELEQLSPVGFSVAIGLALKDA